MRSQSIDQLRALADQKITCAMQHQGRLLLRRLDGYEPHARARDSLADRGGIGRIVLGAPDVSLHVARRHQTHGMSELGQLSRPVVGRRARLHADQTWRQLLEKLDDLPAAELPRDDNLPILVDAMYLKHTYALSSGAIVSH